MPLLRLPAAVKLAVRRVVTAARPGGEQGVLLWHLHSLRSAKHRGEDADAAFCATHAQHVAASSLLSLSQCFRIRDERLLAWLACGDLIFFCAGQLVSQRAMRNRRESPPFAEVKKSCILQIRLR